MKRAACEHRRTCVVCRSSAPKGELLRFVLADGRLLLDEKQRLPGRGAYLHARVECARRMAGAPRWEKALRVEAGTISNAAVQELAGELLPKLLSAEGAAGTERIPGGRVQQKLRL